MTHRKTTIWTPENLEKEAKKYKTRMEFDTKKHTAYEAARNLGILDDICQHMPKPVRWSLASVKAEALSYCRRNDFREFSPGAYNAAKKGKWLDIVCAHMKSKLFSKRKFLKVAKSQTSHDDFHRDYPNIYLNAVRLDWFKENCDQIAITEINFEDFLFELGQHENIAELQENKPTLYYSAFKQGWL